LEGVNGGCWGGEGGEGDRGSGGQGGRERWEMGGEDELNENKGGGRRWRSSRIGSVKREVGWMGIS